MKSMTGYGSSEGSSGQAGLFVEVRSVNQRFLDVKLSAPKEYGPWEAELRRRVGAVVSRGRVDVYIGRNGGVRRGKVEINRDAAAAWVKAWKKLKREFGLAGELDLALLQGRSEVFQSGERKRPSAAELRELKRVLDEALADHAEQREREGAHLCRDMLRSLRALKSLTGKTSRRTAGHAARTRKRIETRVRELVGNGNIDNARLVQEAAVLADRADVNEELVRLASHLDALEDLLGSDRAAGKKIDFVLQEVNRELNTVASKADDLVVTNLMVDAKAEVERLREQVQNLE